MHIVEASPFSTGHQCFILFFRDKSSRVQQIINAELDQSEDGVLAGVSEAAVASEEAGGNPDDTSDSRPASPIEVVDRNVEPQQQQQTMKRKKDTDTSSTSVAYEQQQQKKKKQQQQHTTGDASDIEWLDEDPLTAATSSGDSVPAAVCNDSSDEVGQSMFVEQQQPPLQPQQPMIKETPRPTIEQQPQTPFSTRGGRGGGAGSRGGRRGRPRGGARGKARGGGGSGALSSSAAGVIPYTPVSGKEFMTAGDTANARQCHNCQSYIQEIALLKQEIAEKKAIVDEWDAMIEEKYKLYQSELDLYKLEIQCLQSKVSNLEMNEDFFKAKAHRVLMYTGLHNYSLLATLFDLVQAAVGKDRHLHKITHFQKFILCLMRLRMNLKFKDLACRFDIDFAKIERFFPEWIEAMHKQLSHVLLFPCQDVSTRLLNIGQTLKDHYKVIKDTVPATKLISAEGTIRYNHKLETVCASLLYINELSQSEKQGKLPDVLTTKEEITIEYLKFIGKYISPPLPPLEEDQPTNVEPVVVAVEKSEATDASSVAPAGSEKATVEDANNRNNTQQEEGSAPKETSIALEANDTESSIDNKDAMVALPKPDDGDDSEAVEPMEVSMGADKGDTTEKESSDVKAAREGAEQAPDVDKQSSETIGEQDAGDNNKGTEDDKIVKIPTSEIDFTAVTSQPQNLLTTHTSDTVTSTITSDVVMEESNTENVLTSDESESQTNKTLLTNFETQATVAGCEDTAAVEEFKGSAGNEEAKVTTSTADEKVIASDATMVSSATVTSATDSSVATTLVDSNPLPDDFMESLASFLPSKSAADLIDTSIAPSSTVESESSVTTDALTAALVSEMQPSLSGVSINNNTSEAGLGLQLTTASESSSVINNVVSAMSAEPLMSTGTVVTSASISNSGLELEGVNVSAEQNLVLGGITISASAATSSDSSIGLSSTNVPISSSGQGFVISSASTLSTTSDSTSLHQLGDSNIIPVSAEHSLGGLGGPSISTTSDPTSLELGHSTIPASAADLLSELMGSTQGSGGASVTEELLSVASALARDTTVLAALPTTAPGSAVLPATAADGAALLAALPAAAQDSTGSLVGESSEEMQQESSIEQPSAEMLLTSGNNNCLEKLHLECQSLHEELIDYVELLTRQLPYNCKLNSFDSSMRFFRMPRRVMAEH